MKAAKPQTRTEANEPKATNHLKPGQKVALDLQSDIEHSIGQERENLTDSATTSNDQDKPAKTPAKP